MKKFALIFLLNSLFVSSCSFLTPPTKEEQQKQLNDLNEKYYMDAVENLKRFDSRFKDGTIVSENEDGKISIKLSKESLTLYNFSGEIIPKIGDSYNIKGRLFLDENDATFYYYYPGAGMTKASYDISDKMDQITFTVLSSDNEFTKPFRTYTFKK